MLRRLANPNNICQDMIYKNYRLIHTFGGYATKMWLIYFGYTFQSCQATLADAREWCNNNPAPSINI